MNLIRNSQLNKVLITFICRKHFLLSLPGSRLMYPLGAIGVKRTIRETNSCDTVFSLENNFTLLPLYCWIFSTVK